MSKPVAYPIKKLIGLTEGQVQQIADFRFDHRIASESEAIRQLIEIGLKAAKREG